VPSMDVRNSGPRVHNLRKKKEERKDLWDPGKEEGLWMEWGAIRQEGRVKGKKKENGWRKEVVCLSGAAGGTESECLSEKTKIVEKRSEDLGGSRTKMVGTPVMKKQGSPRAASEKTERGPSCNLRLMRICLGEKGRRLNGGQRPNMNGK